jgi:hypothetical protein
MNQISLLNETLITLSDAAKDFSGIVVPLNTIKRYIYQGVKGNKLESVNINGRYTSKEAIQRFIERKQGFVVNSELARTYNKETEASLRRHGIID